MFFTDIPILKTKEMLNLTMVTSKGETKRTAAQRNIQNKVLIIV